MGRLALRGRGVVSRRVATSLADLHVYDARGSGELPTGVLFHGLGSSATAFGPVLEQLRRESRRVLAPDYPGHGFSDGGTLPLTPEALFESVAGALDALLDEPSILVGNSLGGTVALHYALARPARVSAVVLVSPAGAHASDEEWREIKHAFDIASPSDAQMLMRRLYHRPPWFLPLFAHELSTILGRRAVRDLLETASNRQALSPDSLSSLSMPILLIWGKSERLLPETHFEYFARHLPSHTVIERPEGFGHCPHLEVPHALARRIVAFARSAGLATGARAA
jgi:pimeloyl-ACP methyl ester carboxylesterase